MQISILENTKINKKKLIQNGKLIIGILVFFIFQNGDSLGPLGQLAACPVKG